MTKFIVLDKDGERALNSDAEHLAFKRREEAYAVAQDRAQEYPGEDIEIYQRIAVAIVPTLDAVIKPDGDTSIQKIRDAIAADKKPKRRYRQMPGVKHVK